MSAGSERNRGIRDAIAALALKADDPPIAFVAEMIEQMLSRRAYVVPSPRTTTTQAAKQIEELAAAVRTLRRAAGALSSPAVEALNEEKHRRGLQWAPAHSIWSLLRPSERSKLLENDYPDIEKVAVSAAKKLRASPKAGRSTGAPRDDFLVALAYLLAQHYVTLTGKAPGKSKDGTGPYARFVGAIFAAGEIKGGAAHYAAIGAATYLRRERGENVGKIGWHSYLPTD